VVKGRSEDQQVGLHKPFQDRGHVILLHTFSRGLDPAQEAAQTRFDLQMPQMHQFSGGAGGAHALQQRAQDMTGAALFLAG
jgi:hypothetical protein